MHCYSLSDVRDQVFTVTAWPQDCEYESLSTKQSLFSDFPYNIYHSFGYLIFRFRIVCKMIDQLSAQVDFVRVKAYL